MKIIIIGFGSIGKRHARLLRENKTNVIRAFRSGTHHVELDELSSWNESRRVKPDAIFITNPTHLHVRTALQAIKYVGCPLFIEKPLAHTSGDVKKIVSAVGKHPVPTYVGYQLRFDPVIERLKSYIAQNAVLSARVVSSSYLPSWRPGTNWKKSYSSRKDMGGGVLLDLSHEFDYISYLFGEIKKMRGSFGRVSDLTVDSEDTADIIATTQKGMINIHLDFMSHMRQRMIKIDFKELTIFADLETGRIEEWKKETCINKYRLPSAADDVYRKEHAYFLKNLHNPAMMNSVCEAAPLLLKILSFKRKGYYEG